MRVNLYSPNSSMHTTTPLAVVSRSSVHPAIAALISEGMRMRRRTGRLILLGALAFSPASKSQTFSPGVTKLHGKSNPAASHFFGQAVAASTRFLLVGEPGNGDAAAGAGAAHVFDAVTGRYLRKLVAADAATGDQFGFSVALHGTRAIIGATGDSDKGSGSGSAYVFDLLTGKQLFKLVAADGAATDQFGWAVAISGSTCAVGSVADDDKGTDSGSVHLFNTSSGAPVTKITAADGAAGDFFGYSISMASGLVVVGAPFDTAAQSFSGSAYVFDAATGVQQRKLTAPDPAAQAGFGISVALSGHLALVGAFADDDFGSGSGSAYVMDVRTGSMIKKLLAADGASSKQFGNSVAFSGNLALIAAPTDNGKGNASGSVYLFDAIRGQQLSKMTASDGKAGSQFGVSVALSGNQGLVGANGDGDLGSNAGAAYRFSPLAGPLPLTTIASRGSHAPGTVDARFSSFGRDIFINAQGEVSFQGRLTGAGASGGRAAGVWNTLATGQSLDLALRSRDSVGPGVQVASMLSTYCNHNSNAVMQATLSGTAVTNFNNRALLRDNGTAVIPMLRTGDDPGGIFAGGKLQDMLQVAQSGRDRVSITGRLRQGTGTTPVSASDDSTLFFLNHAGTPIGTVVREGDPVVAGNLGQLFPRLTESQDSNNVGFGSWVLPLGGGAAEQRLYAVDHNAGAMFAAVAQGQNANGTGAPLAQYRTFLGETMSSSGFMAYRARLTGTGVTSQNNEGLWHTNGYQLVVRKGAALDAGEPSTVVRRILQFWAARSGASCFFLVSLTGPKVTPGNDLALYHWDDFNGTVTRQKLMREGDLVEGTDGARVATLQRVDVEQTGRYVVLASLTGSAAANQALFTGRVDAGDGSTLRSQRLPGLRLRKGTLHAAPGSAIARKIRSFNQPAVTDATGAGGKGHGQVIGTGSNVVLSVQFDNQAVEIMSGGL